MAKKILSLKELEKDGRYQLFNKAYRVQYKCKTDDGKWIEDNDYYYSTSKGAYTDVEKRWKEEHPKAVLIRIVYQ